MARERIKALSKEICPYCGGKNIVWLVSDSLGIGGRDYECEICKCSKEKLHEQEMEAETTRKSILRAKCKKYFPFLECDPEITEHRFENFDPIPEIETMLNEVKKACFSYWGNYGLLLIGSYGTGKTRALKTFLYEKYLVGEDGIFVEYARIFDRIFATMEKGSAESKRELMECLINVKNLVIDELGVGTNSAAKEDLFLNILNERRKNRLITHFTMNAEGEKALSGRIHSRLKEFARPIVLPENAPDYRPKVLRKKLEKEKREIKKSA